MTYWNGSGWEADRPATPPRPKRARRFLGAATEAGLITLLTFGLIAGTALAAKGGNGNGGNGNGGGNRTTASVALVVLDGADAVPNHTERVTFEVTTTATDRPFIQLTCWQGSAGVYNNTTGDFDSYMFDPWLTLDSSYWTAGVEASCTARVYHYNKRGQQVDLTSMGFGVAP